MKKNKSKKVLRRYKVLIQGLLVFVGLFMGLFLGGPLAGMVGIFCGILGGELLCKWRFSRKKSNCQYLIILEGLSIL